MECRNTFDSWKLQSASSLWQHTLNILLRLNILLFNRTLLSEMCFSIPDYWISKFNSTGNKNFTAFILPFMHSWQHSPSYWNMLYIYKPVDRSRAHCIDKCVIYKLVRLCWISVIIYLEAWIGCVLNLWLYFITCHSGWAPKAFLWGERRRREGERVTGLQIKYPEGKCMEVKKEPWSHCWCIGLGHS